MKSLTRFLALFFIFLTLSSLFTSTFTVVAVQAVSAPSVPQFNVKLVDYSYNIPPMPTTDPYTGPTTKPGYRIENKAIKVAIKNQPFTPYTDSNSHKINLYYIIQYKGHYEEWSTCADNSYNSTRIVQSDSAYTTYTMPSDKYVFGSEIDFRVQAVIGYDEYVEYTPEQQADIWNSNPMSHMIGALLDGYTQFVEIASSWGGVQTLTIGDGPVIANPNPYAPFNDDNNQQQMPNQTQLSDPIYANPFFLLIICVLSVGVVAAVMLAVLKHREPSTCINDFSPQNMLH